MTDLAIGTARPRRTRDRWAVTGWKFALPGLSVIAIVMGFPLAYAVLLSISSFTLLHPKLLPFVGMENFATVMADEYFWNSVWLTIKYSGITVSAEFLLGLAVALMLNRYLFEVAVLHQTDELTQFSDIEAGGGRRGGRSTVAIRAFAYHVNCASSCVSSNLAMPKPTES